MCGIAGFIGPQQDASVYNAVSLSIAHRGPDAGTVSIEDDLNLSLIHRRLSVLDLEGGNQPMWNADRSMGVIFNGEIYNYLELRQELIAKGYKFQTTNSDTECLVHGYSEWGSDLSSRLNGMFAFVIIDRRNRQLYFSRDRFGEKPLFIYQDRDVFAFASETQAFEAYPPIQLEHDALGLAKYFAYGFFPKRTTLFKKVGQLGAGEHFILPLGDGTTVSLPHWQSLVEKYWSFSIREDTGVNTRSEKDVIAEFWDHLSRAAKRRLVSDVPVGVFLSGGLDSSAVLAAVSEHLPADQINCFTIGFEDPTYDESEHAQAVARHFGCKHHLKRFGQQTLLDGVNDILPHMHQPLADPSLLPTALLSTFAREQVTVALSGDGSDELLAGYDPFLALKFAKLCHFLAMPFTVDLAKKLLRLLPKKDNYMSFDFKIARALTGIAEQRPLWEPVWMGPLSPKQINKAMGTDFTREELFSDLFELYENLDGATTLDQALSYFTQFYLTDNILVKVDRAAMKSSLESRAVFLDNDLVDFCQTLPGHFKLRGKSRKHILKEALREKIPSHLIDRRKQGFGIPFSRWLRETDVTNVENSVPFLDESFVNRALDRHKGRIEDQRIFLFSWLAATKSLTKQA